MHPSTLTFSRPGHCPLGPLGAPVSLQARLFVSAWQ